MATYSTILGLKLNGESDPFQLSDFIANWNVLDASPGIFICTSTSRPNWNTSQAGRMIFMKDLKQLSFWGGTAWNDLRDAAPVFAGGVYMNVACNPGSSSTHTLLTFTTPRPCALSIWLTGTYNFPDNKDQDAWQSVSFDGVQQLMGGFREQIRFAGAPDASGTPSSGENATSMAVIPSVPAGQHKIGIQVDVSSTYKTAISLVGAKTIGMISLYASNNSL